MHGDLENRLTESTNFFHQPSSFVKSFEPLKLESNTKFLSFHPMLDAYSQLLLTCVVGRCEYLLTLASPS